MGYVGGCWPDPHTVRQNTEIQPSRLRRKLIHRPPLHEGAPSCTQTRRLQSAFKHTVAVETLLRPWPQAPLSPDDSQAGKLDTHRKLISREQTPPPFLAQWVLAGCLVTPYQKVASQGQTNHLGFRVCHDQNLTWRQNYIPLFLPCLDKDQSPRSNVKDHQPLPRASILDSECWPDFPFLSDSERARARRKAPNARTS